MLLENFEIRRASGGAGRWHGGDGAIRRLRFLEPATAAILSERRRVPPHGMAGGRAGAPGRNRVIRAGGEVVELQACDQIEMKTGDCFSIETPGGGGYGIPAA